MRCTRLLLPLGMLLGSTPAAADLADSIGMHFVVIPPGSFMMGSPDTELERQGDEGPCHLVTIDYSFEMMTTEVTEAMWSQVMGSACDEDSTCPVWGHEQEEYENFIEALNSMDSEYFYRLPSEAEWEYACRAGSTTRFFWGDDALNNETDLFAWYRGSNYEEADGFPGFVQAVGQKRPNAWGLYDMCGNVWELCQDHYIRFFDDLPTDGSAYLENTYMYTCFVVAGPEPPAPTNEHVVRGGCTWSEPFELRSANRDYYYGGIYTNSNCGLRLVRTPR